ncbi:MAG: hypothetical protein ABL962_11880, partial [Fimbriimonadaceae bacterium]
MRTSNILLLYWVTATILGATPFPIKAAPPIEQSEIEQAITDLQGGSDLARADLVRNLIELGNRRADEDTKI